MERFDIYDEAMNPIGTATREETHRMGYWHRTFQCWIARMERDEPYLLLQLRHPDKDTHPNKLDKSCAGHLTAGERIEDGVRELEEELGLAVPFEALTDCGVVRIESVEQGWADREFCHMFAYRSDRDLTDYRPQAEEISGLYWIRARDLFGLADGSLQEAPLRGVLWNAGSWREHERSATIGDFVPQTAEYYRCMQAGLRKLGVER